MAVPEVEAELQEARRAARENAPAPAGPLEHVGHAGQIADLLDAVETGGTPLCDGVQGRNAIELITAIYASAEEGRPVELPLSRKHGFYAPGATQERMARFMSRK
jgi:predicted dehydrogenase